LAFPQPDFEIVECEWPCRKSTGRRRPIFSEPSARLKEKVPGSSCPLATARPWLCISGKSRGEEHEQLAALTRKGRGPAQRPTKARILLKADASEAGEVWSDNQIIEALETSASMVYRVRKQLAEEGLEAVLSRKLRAMPAVSRIFNGEKEAKLIALACSQPTKGRTRWTLRLLENKFVEPNIFDRARPARDTGAVSYGGVGKGD
jgi:hypothetical protein